MVRKVWYRNEIAKYMAEKTEPTSTHDIWGHLNAKYKYGVSIQCVVNLLAKNKHIKNVSPKHGTSGYKSNQITYWVFKDGKSR